MLMKLSSINNTKVSDRGKAKGPKAFPSDITEKGKGTRTSVLERLLGAERAGQTHPPRSLARLTQSWIENSL